MIVVHVLTRLLKAGSEENTLASCKHQVENGHTVHLLFGKDYSAAVLSYAQELGVHCLRIEEMIHTISPADDLRAIRRIRKELNRIKPDIVHSHQSKAGVLARLASIGGDFAVVHGVHIIPFENESFTRKWLYLSVEKFCARFTDYFIDVSEGTKDAYVRHSLGHPDNHQVVYSGMEISKFKNAASYKRRPNLDLLDTVYKDSSNFIVVMLAAFEDRKRHKALIHSLQPILNANRKIHIVFCGDGETRSEIENLVAQKDLSGNVHFPGFVKDPENFIATANLGVLVSEREGLPRVLVQFAAAGVPTVTTWLRGIGEIVHHKKNGIVRGGNDVDAVARDIGRLAEDEVAYQTLKTGAKKIDVTRWEIQHMGGQIEKVYEKSLLKYGT